MITWMDVAPSPIALRDLLKAHRLFPDSIEDPVSLIRYAGLVRAGYVGTNLDPSAVLLESPLDGGSILLQVVLRDKDFHVNPDMAQLAAELADRWFEHMKLRRVEVRVECHRNPTIKFLKAIGFHQETGPSGVRDAFLRDGEPVSIHVLGLLPQDKPRIRLNRPKVDAIINTKGEVAHGL